MDRRHRHHVGGGEQAVAGRAVHLADQLDPTGRRGGCGLAEGGLLRPGPGDHQAGAGAPDACGGGGDGGALDRHQPSEEEDDRDAVAWRARGGGGAQPRELDPHRADLGESGEARACRARRGSEQEIAELARHEREAQTRAGRGDRREGAERADPTQRVDVTGVGDGEDRAARRRHHCGEGRGDQPVRDDGVPAAGAPRDLDGEARGEGGGVAPRAAPLERLRSAAAVEQAAARDADRVVAVGGPAGRDHLDLVALGLEVPRVLGDEASGRISVEARIRGGDQTDPHGRSHRTVLDWACEGEGHDRAILRQLPRSA